jgi:hypothetical protein
MTAALTIVTAMAFAAVDEPGADALVGLKGESLVPESGDTMVYGDGGTAKTTLTHDLGCHLAAGDPWLGVPIGKAVNVLIIESEGPRPLLRDKIESKLASWKGSTIKPSRLTILEDPWGAIDFTDKADRAKLAAMILKHEIDVVIAGPVTRLGMNEAGTLQEVRDFMGCLNALRAEVGRPLAFVLVHHEGRSGAVSGAWEGAVDTLLHTEKRGHGHTSLKIEKARWSSAHHDTHLELTWTDGEGFAVEDARDYAAEIATLLADGKWRTVGEIGNKRDAPKMPGIGAGKDSVKDALDRHPGRFIERKGGKDIGRHPNATVYGLDSAHNPDGLDTDPTGPRGRLDSTTHYPVGVGSESRHDPPSQLGLDSTLDLDAGSANGDGGDTPESDVSADDVARAERVASRGEG